MGLLTDVRGGQNPITDFIIKRHNIICCLLYLGGIGLFLALAHDSLNNKTYFSENALLPGLVNNEFHDENLATTLYEELLEEQKKYKDSVPYSWLSAKFNQLGLDVYTHNFTLKYPLQNEKYFYGKNVYGILRAPRAASTEALVLSTPYRSPSSIHSTTAPSIALMISFAKFCKQQKYWAKDIIFLIVEHEQLGMQAWLEAYLGVEKTTFSALNSGTLTGRAGSIQAAINLEFHDSKIGYIDIKIEGLNGQLPNLDLVNLADRIATMERIRHTFKQRSQSKRTDPFKKWVNYFDTLTSMVLSMATGIPTGNHGLYHRYGIEAITLEGFPKEGSQSYVTYYTLGRLLEGIFRSLNNLLEKFHQSYFFYLLPSLSNFVSIGTYIGCLVAFTATLLIKALALWLQIREKPEIIGLAANRYHIHNRKRMFNDEPADGDTGNDEINCLTCKEPMDSTKVCGKHFTELHVDSIDVNRIGIIILVTHAIGILSMNIPSVLTVYFEHELSTEKTLFYGFLAISSAMFLIPFTCRLINYKSVMILNIISLLELGTVLTAIGLHNFSLGFIIGLIYVPIILFISPPSKRTRKRYFQIFFWILLQPFFVVTTIVIAYTYITFAEEPLVEVIYRGVSATQQAIVFTVVDSLIYGNWLFNVVTAVFLPNWMCLYFMFFFQNNQQKLKKE